MACQLCGAEMAEDLEVLSSFPVFPTINVISLYSAITEDILTICNSYNCFLILSPLGCKGTPCQ